MGNPGWYENLTRLTGSRVLARNLLTIGRYETPLHLPDCAGLDQMWLQKCWYFVLGCCIYMMVYTHWQQASCQASLHNITYIHASLLYWPLLNTVSQIYTTAVPNATSSTDDSQQ